MSPNAVLPWLADAAPPADAGRGGGPPSGAGVAGRPSDSLLASPTSGTRRATTTGGSPSVGRIRQRVAELDSRRLGALLAAVLAAVALWPRGSAVSTPFLSYTAPAGWTADPATATAPLDAPALTGTMHGARYDCGGEAYLRGYAAAALLPADASPGSGPADRAERLARWFATASFAASDGTAPAVTAAPPRPVRVAGPDGPVDATVTEVTARATTGGGCAPSGGTVLALAAPVSGGAALLLVAADAGGGPADPAPPDRAALDAVLASVRLGPA